METLIPYKFSHRDLVKIAYRWVKANASCGVVFKELVTTAAEIPDVIGFGSGDHSVLVECKTSRSDFLADKNKPFRISGRGMGKYRLFCAPVGVIRESDLPAKWGLIQVNDKGKAVAIVNPMRKGWEERLNWQHDGRDLIAERAIMYSALRRLYIRGLMDNIYTPAPILP